MVILERPCQEQMTFFLKQDIIVDTHTSPLNINLYMNKDGILDIFRKARDTVKKVYTTHLQMAETNLSNMQTSSSKIAIKQVGTLCLLKDKVIQKIISHVKQLSKAGGLPATQTYVFKIKIYL